MGLRDRERKIDVESLPTEQVDSLAEQIGPKLRDICEEAASKANAFLAVYGLSAKIAIKFNKLDKNGKHLDEAADENDNKGKEE